MKENRRTDFRIYCRKNTEYILQKKNITKIIRDREYVFSITTAICTECGEEMPLQGLIDKNIREVDEHVLQAY